MSHNRSIHVHRFVNYLLRFRYGVLVFWLLCLGFGGWLGPRLLSNTSLAFEAPASSDSTIAENKLSDMFPNASSSLMILYIQTPPGVWVITNQTEGFLLDMEKKMEGESSCSVISIIHYYNTPLPGLLRSRFISHRTGYNATFALINTEVLLRNPNHCVNTLRKYIDDGIKKYFPHGNFTAALTGLTVFGTDIQKGTERDLLVMDLIALPFAFLVLMLVLRSARLLVIPLLNICISALTSFLIMYPISKHISVVSFAPSVMMSATLAMSIDYSLFLLSRYREELLRGTEPTKALIIMISSAGHTVLVSGFTLAICFLGLIFFPITLLSSVGAGAAIAVIVAVIVNITLTPVLLNIFESFFIKCTDPFFSLCRKKYKKIDVESESLLSQHDNYYYGDDDNDDDDDDDDDFHIATRNMRGTLWYRIGKAVVRFPWLTVFIVVAVCSPCAYYAVSFQRSSSILMFTPRNSDATIASKKFSAAFGIGQMYPFSLVIEPSKGHSLGPRGIIDDNSFNEIRIITSRLNFSESIHPTFTSIAIADGLKLDSNTMWNCHNNSLSLPHLDFFCEMYLFLFSRFVSKDLQSTYVTINLPDVDSFGPNGSHWISEARDELRKREAESNYTFNLAGIAAIDKDVEDSVYRAFPTVIGVTTAVVLLLFGAAFRSVVIPLHAVFSIVLTLAVVYGSANFVYQRGSLNWLGLAGLHGEGALNWIAPVLNFSILVGLAIDYNCFYLFRVMEYRRAGKSTYEATLFGLSKTGSIITAAGIIMTLAYGGLLFSQEDVLNQLSFFLVVSVLFDTFVVRTILVPAIVVLCGERNWWPVKMPKIKTKFYERL